MAVQYSLIDNVSTMASTVINAMGAYYLLVMKQLTNVHSLSDMVTVVRHLLTDLLQMIVCASRVQAGNLFLRLCTMMGCEQPSKMINTAVQLPFALIDRVSTLAHPVIKAMGAYYRMVKEQFTTVHSTSDMYTIVSHLLTDLRQLVVCASRGQAVNLIVGLCTMIGCEQILNVKKSDEKEEERHSISTQSVIESASDSDEE